MAPLALIWFKLPGEEMKDMKYVFDTTDEDMVELQAAGRRTGEIDVFLEHDCSSHSPKSIGFISSSQHEDEREYEDGAAEKDGGYEPEKEVDSDDDCPDMPREDVEGEQSEDEDPVAEQEEEVVQEDLSGNQNDDGDDVVLDAGDGGDNVRFKTVFEEGAKTAADFQTSQMRDTEENIEHEREAAESEEEDRSGDVKYPDTPVESEEE
ncbi:hypothetical protein N665_0100s0017 [Sinapis alba]|nr:hypothetical protein N665_0100s0017 [Sinapis alba]